MSEVPPFDPERILRVFARHGVSYILMGAFAARLQGFPRFTTDTDITPDPDPDNLDRLSAALRELDARVVAEDMSEGHGFDCSARTLSNAEIWNLTTTAGRVDIVFKPGSTGGYLDLEPTSIRYEAFGIQFRVASLPDIIRSKEASDRPQDRQDIATMRTMLERRGSA